MYLTPNLYRGRVRTKTTFLDDDYEDYGELTVSVKKVTSFAVNCSIEK